MTEERKSISVIYERAKNANTVPVSGAYGGLYQQEMG